jgi:hypothetical protein
VRKRRLRRPVISHYQEEHVSDQDFFFDEDEKPSKPAPSKSSAKSSSAKPVATSAKSTSAPAGGFELTWTITALIGVVALLLGVIVGYAIPKGADIASPTTPTSTQTSAPQLTPEQLSTGELPAGHPSVGGASGAATGSAAGTGTTGN